MRWINIYHPKVKKLHTPENQHGTEKSPTIEKGKSFESEPNLDFFLGGVPAVNFLGCKNSQKLMPYFLQNSGSAMLKPEVTGPVARQFTSFPLTWRLVIRRRVWGESTLRCPKHMKNNKLMVYGASLYGLINLYLGL